MTEKNLSAEQKAIILAGLVVGLSGASTLAECLNDRDPVELVSDADGAGCFVQFTDGLTYFRDAADGRALMSAPMLRILAQELDNRNGVGLRA